MQIVRTCTGRQSPRLQRSCSLNTRSLGSECQLNRLCNSSRYLCREHGCGRQRWSIRGIIRWHNCTVLIRLEWSWIFDRRRSRSDSRIFSVEGSILQAIISLMRHRTKEDKNRLKHQVKREQTAAVEKCEETANCTDTNSRAVKYQWPLPDHWATQHGHDNYWWTADRNPMGVSSHNPQASLAFCFEFNFA